MVKATAAMVDRCRSGVGEAHRRREMAALGSLVTGTYKALGFWAELAVVDYGGSGGAPPARHNRPCGEPAANTPRREALQHEGATRSPLVASVLAEGRR